jgi:hypothetical protein
VSSPTGPLSPPRNQAAPEGGRESTLIPSKQTEHLAQTDADRCGLAPLTSSATAPAPPCQPWPPAAGGSSWPESPPDCLPAGAPPAAAPPTAARSPPAWDMGLPEIRHRGTRMWITPDKAQLKCHLLQEAFLAMPSSFLNPPTQHLSLCESLIIRGTLCRLSSPTPQLCDLQPTPCPLCAHFVK